jgi:hypothetical protein
VGGDRAGRTALNGRARLDWPHWHREFHREPKPQAVEPVARSDELVPCTIQPHGSVLIAQSLELGLTIAIAMPVRSECAGDAAPSPANPSRDELATWSCALLRRASKPPPVPSAQHPADSVPQFGPHVRRDLSTTGDSNLPTLSPVYNTPHRSCTLFMFGRA